MFSMSNEEKCVSASKRYLSAESRLTDDFGDKFYLNEGELVYDAKTVNGPWACMTHSSFLLYGEGLLGTGRGQRYCRTADNKLVKDAG
jgi:hypothetical protein